MRFQQNIRIQTVKQNFKKLYLTVNNLRVESAPPETITFGLVQSQHNTLSVCPVKSYKVVLQLQKTKVVNLN